MVMGVAEEWKRHHVSAACTSEVYHPEGQSPARSISIVIINL